MLNFDRIFRPILIHLRLKHTDSKRSLFLCLTPRPNPIPNSVAITKKNLLKNIDFVKWVALSKQNVVSSMLIVSTVDLKTQLIHYPDQ